MTDPATCPRRHPDTGQRCGAPLPDVDDAGRPYGYRPCPACADDVAARHRAALHARLVAVAAALDAGHVLNEDGQFVRPDDPGDDGGEVIAGDRAGAPSRRSGSASTSRATRPRDARPDPPAGGRPRPARRDGSGPQSARKKTEQRPSRDRLRRRP